MASRISSLFLFILDQKKLLLRHNKIDQIIICCTVRCLEKEPKEKTTMDKIVRDYNSLRLSHNLNQFGLSDDNGNVWDLREYYRRVFLKEL